MKRILLSIIITSFAGVLAAQQVATYSQYMFNGLAINPAYAGHHDALSATALGRFQNVGLKGAPNTQTFSAHSPLVNNKGSVGLLVIHDQLSVINQTGVHFSYAYRIPLNSNQRNQTKLSFGLQGGVSMYNAKYTELETRDQNDPAFASDIRESRPNIGAGLFLNNNDYYIGLSMPSMLNNVFERGEDYETVYQSKPIILTGGYVFLINRMFKLKPNFLFKAIDNRPVEFDLNVNGLFDEVLWFGLSYKSSRQVVMMTQLQVTEQIQFGYSYTLSAGPIRVVELGTHEVMLNYRFWFNKKGVVSPRYF
jgi:type IX secretion system PorP/SprF family membrane protein